jgi:hypothetical protein
MLIALDPGVWHVGFACFVDKRLVDAGVLFAKPWPKGLTKTAFEKSMRGMDRREAFRGLCAAACARFVGYPGADVLVEAQQVYREEQANPNNLLEIARVGYVLATDISRDTGGGLDWVLPRDWKGSVPKKIMLNRIMSKLTDTERTLIDPLTLKQDGAIDAAGIGLWKLGRLGNRG